MPARQRPPHLRQARAGRYAAGQPARACGAGVPACAGTPAPR